jgi:hypothetical protein
MLAVTAGTGACGENSTQPTARVSTLTANGMVRFVLRPRQQAKLAGGIKDKEHARSQKFREGPWPKTRDRECKATASTKHRYGTCIFKPWPRIFEVRIGLNLRPLARAKLRALRAQPHPRQLSRGRCTRQNIDPPSRPSWFSDSVFGDFVVAKPQGTLRLVRIQCSTCALAAATLDWLQAMRFVTFSSWLRTSDSAWRTFSRIVIFKYRSSSSMSTSLRQISPQNASI